MNVHGGDMLFYVFLFGCFVVLASVFYSLKIKAYDRREKKVGKRAPTRFIALVAACNEEAGIERSIRSLRTQRKIECVVVVLNNTTDSTPEILAKLQRKYGEWLVVLTMKRNRNRKAGALNYGLRYINKRCAWKKDEYVILTLDADTVIGQGICREVAKVFKSNPHAGGVNIQCLLQDIDTISGGQRPMIRQRLWYAFQTVEYTLAMPQKLSQYPKTRILAGACSALRLTALRDVQQSRRIVWRHDTLVEDYDLTRELHRIGWETPPANVEAYTDAPLCARSLYRQRKRWYTGTITMLWGDLRKKFCIDDAWVFMNVCMAPLLFVLQFFIVGLVIARADWSLLICAPLFVTAFAYFIQFAAFHRGSRHGKSVLAWVVVAIPFFYQAYVMWNEVLYSVSMMASVKHSAWRWE